MDQHCSGTGGGHWGVLNTAIPPKNLPNTAISQKKSQCPPLEGVRKSQGKGVPENYMYELIKLKLNSEEVVLWKCQRFFSKVVAHNSLQRCCFDESMLLLYS